MARAGRVLAVAQARVLGGAELALVRLARLLPERGFELVAAVPDQGPLADALAEADVPVRIVPVGGLGRGRWPRAVIAWPRARAATRATAPDLVWLNGAVTLRLTPALGGGAPFVPYLHDLLDRSPRPWRSERFWRRTPVVLCASEAVAERAERAGAPADRIRVVWAPVERPAPAPRPAWANGAPVIGYVGRIEPRKGALDLLRALPAVLERRPGARLVVVGAAELGAPTAYAEAVEREAAALGGRVLMLGRVPDAPALMPWFDVLAVPSREEPFGTVAAEAIAAGTPVVATRSGGMSDYVRPGVDGELVPPGEPAALARAIADVLDRGRPGGRAPAVERFAPGAVADAVAESFRAALAAAR